MSARLTVQGRHGAQHFLLCPGGGVVFAQDGVQFRVDLEPDVTPASLPLPSEFDIREMDTEAIVAFLLERVQTDAADNREWDYTDE